MKRQRLLLTVVGGDRSGIVEEITGCVVSNAGNVDESRSARLGGQFAAFLLVSVPTENIDALLRDLASHDSDDLSVTSRPLAASGPGPGREGLVPYILKVDGADHEGIIHEVAALLAAKGINIAEMRTSVYNSPISGSPMFAMRATVEVPRELRARDLRSWLDDLSDELAVDIHLTVRSAGGDGPQPG